MKIVHRRPDIKLQSAIVDEANQRFTFTLSNGSVINADASDLVFESENTGGGSGVNCDVNTRQYSNGALRVWIGQVQLVSARGNPNGTYQANRGSMFFDTDGFWYVKTGTGISTWKPLAICE
jgi:hypothetical protein